MPKNSIQWNEWFSFQSPTFCVHILSFICNDCSDVQIMTWKHAGHFNNTLPEKQSTALNCVYCQWKSLLVCIQQETSFSSLTVHSLCYFFKPFNKIYRMSGAINQPWSTYSQCKQHYFETDHMFLHLTHLWVFTFIKIRV